VLINKYIKRVSLEGTQRLAAMVNHICLNRPICAICRYPTTPGYECKFKEVKQGQRGGVGTSMQIGSRRPGGQGQLITIV